MIIGNKIKHLVENGGYSANRMAKKIGITSAYMYKILKMESVDTKYLVKIAEVLNVPVEIFFMEDKLEENFNPSFASREKPPSKEPEPTHDLSDFLKETIKAQSKLIEQLENNIDYLKNTVRKYDSITQDHLKEFKSIVSKEENDFLLGRVGNK